MGRVGRVGGCTPALEAFILMHMSIVYDRLERIEIIGPFGVNFRGGIQPQTLADIVPLIQAGFLIHV